MRAPPSEVVEWPIAAEEIWRFAARLHKICMWTPECLVVSLLFLIRYLSYTPSVVLHARNWRRLVFTATMVAQKYWDDRSLKNARAMEAVIGDDIRSALSALDEFLATHEARLRKTPEAVKQAKADEDKGKADIKAMAKK